MTSPASAGTSFATEGRISSSSVILTSANTLKTAPSSIYKHTLGCSTTLMMLILVTHLRFLALRNTIDREYFAQQSKKLGMACCFLLLTVASFTGCATSRSLTMISQENSEKIMKPRTADERLRDQVEFRSPSATLKDFWMGFEQSWLPQRMVKFGQMCPSSRRGSIAEHSRSGLLPNC